MKKTAAAILVALGVLGAHAQILGDALGGAALGAIISALAGGGGGCGYYYRGNSCDNAANGAAIGAGIGLIAGALVGVTERAQYANSAPVSATYQATPAFGYGYIDYSAPPSGYAPAPTTPRPNYAVGGTLLGAASGALIGQGVNQDPGVGAAIGAASGLVLGGIAQAATRPANQSQNPTPSAPASGTYPAAPDTSTQNPAALLASQAAPANAQPHHSSLPVPSVPASRFVATVPQHQIPDAPRVPDAPTF